MYRGKHRQRFFDTKDWLLQRNRMALRVRQIARRWVQTLKTSPRDSGTLSTRGEWETPARVVRGRGSIDLARLSESPLPGLLAKQKERAELLPVFRTRVRRAQWTVERGDTSIEVSLDIGGISTEVEHQWVNEPICELELELKQSRGEGGAAALFDQRSNYSMLAVVAARLDAGNAQQGRAWLSTRDATSDAGRQSVSQGVHRRHHESIDDSGCAACGGCPRTGGVDGQHRRSAAR